MKLEFEWHVAKAKRNLLIHGVSFELAKTTLRDPFAIRTAEGDYPVVRGLHRTGRDRIRIISARRATQYEQDDYVKQNSQTDDSRSYRARCSRGS